MKKTLRLLVTKNCNRSCEGCCNKQWNLKKLPLVNFNEINNYKEIILTGGEPMIDPNKIFKVINKIKQKNKDLSIYMYTAKIDNITAIKLLLMLLDGITITIHEEKDWTSFLNLNNRLNEYELKKSLRLNIFKEAGYQEFTNSNKWVIKKNIEWIENCPLPENEEFKKWKN